MRIEIKLSSIVTSQISHDTCPVVVVNRIKFHIAYSVVSKELKHTDKRTDLHFIVSKSRFIHRKWQNYFFLLNSFAPAIID